MSRCIFAKIVFILIVGILVVLSIALVLTHNPYPKIFRLSYSQIQSILGTTTSPCNKISDCQLSPGDILIRRYITPRTQFIEKFGHIYFTHVAFYTGNDQIVEAVGTENDPKDDIQVATLSKSDWFNTDVNDFVIIRPKNYSDKLPAVIDTLKKIADDPDYRFGLPVADKKLTTCADLVFRQLIDQKIISIENAPAIITPDYLFWIVKNNPDKFEIVGYAI